MTKPTKLTTKNRIAIGQKTDLRRCASVSIMKKPISIGSVINLEKNRPYRTMHTPTILHELKYATCPLIPKFMLLMSITKKNFFFINKLKNSRYPIRPSPITTINTGITTTNRQPLPTSPEHPGLACQFRLHTRCAPWWHWCQEEEEQVRGGGGVSKSKAYLTKMGMGDWCWWQENGEAEVVSVAGQLVVPFWEQGRVSSDGFVGVFRPALIHVNLEAGPWLWQPLMALANSCQWGEMMLGVFSSSFFW